MSSQVVAKGAVDAAPFVRLELIAAALRTEVLPAEWWGGADGRGPSRVLRTEFLAGPLPPPRPPRRFMGPGERRARRLHLVRCGRDLDVGLCARFRPTAKARQSSRRVRRCPLREGAATLVAVNPARLKSAALAP